MGFSDERYLVRLLLKYLSHFNGRLGRLLSDWANWAYSRVPDPDPDPDSGSPPRVPSLLLSSPVTNLLTHSNPTIDVMNCLNVTSAKVKPRVICGKSYANEIRDC